MKEIADCGTNGAACSFSFPMVDIMLAQMCYSVEAVDTTESTELPAFGCLSRSACNCVICD